MRGVTFPWIAALCALAVSGVGGCSKVASDPSAEYSVMIVATETKGQVCPVKVEPPAGTCSSSQTTNPQDICVHPGDILSFQLVDEKKAARPRKFKMNFEKGSPLGWEYWNLWRCSTSSGQGALRCKVRDQLGQFDYAVKVDSGCGADPSIFVNRKAIFDPRNPTPAAP